MNKNLFFIVAVLFFIGEVFALGVTPGRTTLDFEAGMKKTVNFEILNSEGKDLNLTVRVVDGELSEYITFPFKEVFISASEGSKSFSYEINLPATLSPGLHTGEILIMESPGQNSMGETQVLATLAVVTQIHIYVPYPGKYANAKMVVYNANQGEEVTFVFPVVSAGEFDLTSVRASVDIYNSMSEKVGSFSTSSIDVPSGEKKELVYKWKADVPIGEYRAKGALIYDEGSLNFEEQFGIGSKEVELKEVSVNDFRLGEIVKLEMLVENKWSELISGAYIETKIMNSEGGVVASFQSPSQNIEAFSTQLFNSYWDTAGVSVGTYETEISVNYADKSSKKNLKFQVEENELIVLGLGYVVSESSEESSNALVTVLIVVIVLLVLINILWFLIIRKKFKK